jgi:hypothetical protein
MTIRDERLFFAMLILVGVVGAPIIASAQQKPAPDPALKHMAYLCKSGEVDACNRLCAVGRYWACRHAFDIHTR